MIYRELRRRARRIISSTLMICVASYFVYHMVMGKHGTIAWQELNATLKLASTKLSLLQAEQQQLENRVKLLRPSSLCLDLLDEQLRALGLSGSNEIVVLHNPEDS